MFIADPFALPKRNLKAEARAEARAKRIAAAIPTGLPGVRIIPPQEIPAPASASEPPKRSPIARSAIAESTASADAPFDITPIDGARLKLRERRRRLLAGSDAAPDLVTLPGVHGFDLAIRYVDGGRDTVVAFIQLAVLEGNPAATAWWAAYADLTTYERKICSFDDVCAASGVRPSILMAAVVSAAMDAGRDAANLIAASTLPEVVSQMAKSGKLIDGQFAADVNIKDRHAFLQGQGFLPVPKGTNIHVHASANAQAAAAVAADPSVPGFSSTMAGLSAARRGAVVDAGSAAARPALPAFLQDGDADADAQDGEVVAVTVPAAGGVGIDE